MRLAITRSWIRLSKLLMSSGPELRREILEIAGDIGEIVLGLEVAALFCAVLVGAADEGGLHGVLGGADEIGGMSGHHHHRAGTVIAEKTAGRLVHLGIG